MSSYKYIAPKQLLSATVSGTTPASSSSLDIHTIKVVGFVITVTSGLNATFQMMVSHDGTNYYDSGQVIDPVTGSAATIIVTSTYIPFPHVLIKVTPSSGSATVTITGMAKT